MEGYIAFRNHRKQMKLSQKELSALAGISPQEITVRENGREPLTGISVVKAIRIFNILNLPMEEFYEKYYPYKSEIKKNISKWKKNHPRTYDIKILKRWIYLRMIKQKSRDSLTEEEFMYIRDLYEKSFSYLESKSDENGCITDELYDEYILNLLYEMKKSKKKDCNPDAVRFLDLLYHTEFSCKDISDITGISPTHLNRCIKRNPSFSSLSVGMCLRISEVLGRRVTDLFDV